MTLITTKTRKKESNPGLVTFYEYFRLIKINGEGIKKTTENWGITMPKPVKQGVRSGVMRDLFRIEDMEKYYSEYLSQKEARKSK